MKIGFDISQTIDVKAGCGYVADTLIRELAEIDSANGYVLYPTFGEAFCDPEVATRTVQIDRPRFRRGIVHKTAEIARVFWASPPEDFESQLGNPDIIHSNNFYCPPRPTKAKLVYTLYDLAFLDHPELTTEQNRTAVFTGVFNASLLADLILSISHYSKEHFLRTFPHYPADRIEVVHLGSRFTPATARAPRPAALENLEAEKFWVCVGTLEPRKNHKRLAKAYAQLKQRGGANYPLVLAGARGWLMEDFENYLDDLGIRQDVIVLGYVDDAALQWLYENCFALLYPSLFEGFGLPVLEAMTLGAPVIASGVSSIPEIVADSSLLIDPCREDEIADAMHRLLVEPDLRPRIKRQVVQQAARFNWRSAAEKTLAAYRRVMQLPGRAGLRPAGRSAQS